MAMRTGGSAARRIRRYSSAGSGRPAAGPPGPASPGSSATSMHLMVRQDAGDRTGPSSTFNLGDLFELVADAIPEREAIVAGERRLTYRQLEDRANRLAHHLLAAGVRAGDHVGLQLLNGTEYVEAMLGAFKIRAVPINVNYRYVDAELAHLFDDADLVAVVLHRQFSPRVAAVKPDLPLLRSLVVVEDGSGEPPPPGAVGYEDALAGAPPERDFGPRSGDDIYCAYTGGTTGMPKGVLWRQEDIFFAAMGGGDPLQSGNFIDRPEEIVDRLLDPGMVTLATPPLMHVSAHWLAFVSLFSGGRLVVTPQGRFDPEAVWRLIGDEKVNVLVIVGDAMARPLADAHREGRHDTSTLIVIGSGGAILSPSTKQKLSSLVPNALLVDGFGASETGTVGSRSSLPGTVGDDDPPRRAPDARRRPVLESDQDGGLQGAAPGRGGRQGTSIAERQSRLPLGPRPRGRAGRIDKGGIDEATVRSRLRFPVRRDTVDAHARDRSDPARPVDHAGWLFDRHGPAHADQPAAPAAAVPRADHDRAPPAGAPPSHRGPGLRHRQPSLPGGRARAGHAARAGGAGGQHRQPPPRPEQAAVGDVGGRGPGARVRRHRRQDAPQRHRRRLGR